MASAGWGEFSLGRVTQIVALGQGEKVKDYFVLPLSFVSPSHPFFVRKHEQRTLSEISNAEMDFPPALTEFDSHC